MDGARLVLVSPDGQVRLFSEDFQSACDPNVSFDGERVLFAGKKRVSDPWRIWERRLNGEELRPVSPAHLDARHPVYAATLFTLDSPEPWPAAVFAGQERGLNETGQPFVSSLYNVKLDGTELRRLTYNPNRNTDPFQMWDGRILYAAERYSSVAGAAAAHVGLYAVHVEGTDMERYGAEAGGRIQQMPCATEKGLVLFVESAEASPEGAGQLACVEERRPHVKYRRLTCDPQLEYRYPAPLTGSRVLVSRRTAGSAGDWGIFCYDTERGNTESICDSSEYDEVQAVLAARRPRPDGHSTVVDTKLHTGIFYGLNCYDSTLSLAQHVRTGQVKRVRFMEGVPQKSANSDSSSRIPFVPRRLIGEAPVEPDGSFNVEVPADVPLLLQTLDEQGLALGTCGWIWVKPKEKRGCIGCHEDPERIPENNYVLALRRPSNRLVLPAAERRIVSFREVMPIFQRYCATAGCHGGHDTPLHLPLSGAKPSESELKQAYQTLLEPANGTESSDRTSAGRYVNPGQARTSWLIWQLLGRNASLLSDSDPARRTQTERKITKMPPLKKGVSLRADELQTVIQWIDLGAPFALAPEPEASLGSSE